MDTVVAAVPVEEEAMEMCFLCMGLAPKQMKLLSLSLHFTLDWCGHEDNGSVGSLYPSDIQLSQHVGCGYSGTAAVGVVLPGRFPSFCCSSWLPLLLL